MKTPDGVNAQNILTGKCAEYSSTNEATGSNAFRYCRLRQKRTRLEPSHDPGDIVSLNRATRLATYADLRTALSTSVLPSDQIAPGTLWLAAMTSSNDFSIQLQSSSVITSGGSSLMVWLPWPETCVRIL